jgi:hypothetical protein
MSVSISGRWLVLALGVAITAAGFVVALGGSAAAGVGACPDKTLCVYADDGFDSQMVKIDGKGISNKLAKKMNNEASSVINNRNKRAYLYDRRNGKGEKICLSPKANYHDLGGSFDFNDVASSSRNTNNKDDCPQ